MRIRAFLIGTASAMALFSGAAHAQRADDVPENIGLTISGMNLTDSEYYAYANTQRLPRGVYRTGRRALASVNVNF